MHRSVALLAVLTLLVSCLTAEPARPLASQTGSRAQADTTPPGTVSWRVASQTGLPLSLLEFAIATRASGELILFGGATSGPPGSPSDTLDQTWAWDGAAWAQRAPTVVPPARTGHAMAYDAERQRIIMFGGADAVGSALGDTWAWLGTEWLKLSPAASPSARRRHAMAYDPTRKAIVLFGGCAACGTDAFDDTWEWDGATWSLAARTAVTPRGRQDAAMAFDGTAILMFGGRDVPGQNGDVVYDDTWLWDGAAWTSPPQVLSPARRSHAGVAFDPRRKRVLLYAGNSCFRPCKACQPRCGAYDEAWEWDGARWAQRSPLPIDSNNGGTTRLSFDPVRQAIVLVSGHGDGENLRTWEYAAYADACAADGDCDASFCRATSGQAPTGNPICCLEACGACQDCDFTGKGCVPVLARDDLDACTGASTCDPAGHCKKKLGQGCADGTECASAICTDGACCTVLACAPYVCGAAGACTSSCKTAKDCAADHDCLGGACVAPPVSCAGDLAVKTDGTRTACAPYTCGTVGCLTQCGSSDDCAAGFVCSSLGACVTPRSSVPGSCSATAVRGGGGAGRAGAVAWAAAALLSLALVRRRRRAH